MGLANPRLHWIFSSVLFRLGRCGRVPRLPSSYLECINIVNDSKQEGEKIQCFSGAISLVHEEYRVPLSGENFVKSGALLRNWVALDKGSDLCPISYHLPQDYNTTGTENRCRYHNCKQEWYGLYLILVREQDLAGMYSEETNLSRSCSSGSHPPGDEKWSWGSHCLEYHFICSLIRWRGASISCLSNGPNWFSLIHQLCSVLLKAQTALKRILPFLIRCWKFQCSFCDITETEGLMKSLDGYLENFCSQITADQWKLLRSVSDYDDKAVCLKLRAIQRIGIRQLCSKYGFTSDFLSPFFSIIV